MFYPDAQPYLLRSFGRVIHSQRSLDVVVEDTVYDLMLAIIKEDQDYRMFLQKTTPTKPAIICCLLNGDNIPRNSSTNDLPKYPKSMSKFISFVQSLDIRVVHAIGNVINEENKSVALSRVPNGTPTNNVDFRIYRKVFSRYIFLRRKSGIHSRRIKTTLCIRTRSIYRFRPFAESKTQCPPVNLTNVRPKRFKINFLYASEHTRNSPSSNLS